MGNIFPSMIQINPNTLKINMSSKEMQTFNRIFPLLVEDLVSENNEIWLLFMNFLKIGMLLQSNFSDQFILT